MIKELKKVSQNELNPNVSVDCVIFGFDLEKLTVLLIDRGRNKRDKGIILALPGNLIYTNEHLDQAANRVLNELTGLNDIYLEIVRQAMGGRDLEENENKIMRKIAKTVLIDK